METHTSLTITEQKIHFLRHNLITYLKKLSGSEKGKWGVMNAQQMVEHLSYSMRVSNGKDNQPLSLPQDRSEKVREFFLSEKPFRENSKNFLLSEDPYPIRNATMLAAIEELQTETHNFVLFFCNEKGCDLCKTSMNPLAGPFTYQEWVHLHYKHSLHHLLQFGLT
jgi:hypothetical protein